MLFWIIFILFFMGLAILLYKEIGPTIRSNNGLPEFNTIQDYIEKYGSDEGTTKYFNDHIEKGNL